MNLHNAGQHKTVESEIHVRIKRVLKKTVQGVNLEVR